MLTLWMCGLVYAKFIARQLGGSYGHFDVHLFCIVPVLVVIRRLRDGYGHIDV